MILYRFYNEIIRFAVQLTQVIFTQDGDISVFLEQYSAEMLKTNSNILTV